MDWLAAGLAFGFLGSAHCVGMCGPLAMGLPGAYGRRRRFLAERGLYNLGRVVTYTALGVAFGALGLLVSLAGLQQWLSFGLGVLLLFAAVVPWAGGRAGRLGGAPAGLLRRVVTWIQVLYRQGGTAALLAVGMLNGLLPCGFVYAALATATASGSVTRGALFMAAFGLGTFPAMFVVSAAGRLLSLRWRTRLQRLVPYVLAVLGLLLILRGLSLGVFLSPDLRAALFSPGVCRFLPFVEPVP